MYTHVFACAGRVCNVCLPRTQVCDHFEFVFATALHLSLNSHVYSASSKPRGEVQGAGSPESHPGKAGTLTMPRVILSHLHFLHAVSRKPARAAFHGPLPETALPDAEHWRDRSQAGRQGRVGLRGPAPAPAPLRLRVACSPLLPSFILLAFSLERFWDPHIREMNRWAQHRTGMWGTETHTDGHTRGETGRRDRGHSPAPAHPGGHCQELRVIVLWLGTRPRDGPGRADPHDSCTGHTAPTRTGPHDREAIRRRACRGPESPQNRGCPRDRNPCQTPGHVTVTAITHSGKGPHRAQGFPMTKSQK